MLLQVVLGITYGAAIGFLNNWLLFRAMAQAKDHGQEIVGPLRRVHAWRLLIVALALLTVARWPAAALATATSAVALSLSKLMVWYRRKGGRIE